MRNNPDQISIHDDKFYTHHSCADKNYSVLVTDNENGEVCCSKCGTVLVEKTIDRANPSRIFSSEDHVSKKANGPPSKLYMSSLKSSSIIPDTTLDASGRKMIPENRARFSRMRLWDSRSKNNKERGFLRAFTILDSFANKLHLPENAKEHSAYIYRKAADRKIIKGHSILSMMSASVYVSCKQLSIPRSIDDVAQIANIPKKTLARSFRRLVRELDLEIISSNIDYVSKVASSVSIGEKSKRISSKILQDAKKEGIHVGKNPIGLTAASVYLSAIGSGEYVTMKKLSQKNNISTVTIRKLVRVLRPFAARYIKTIEVSK